MNQVHLVGEKARQRRGLFYEEIQHAFDYHAGLYHDGMSNWKIHAVTARCMKANPLLRTTAAQNAALLKLAEVWEIR